VLNTHYYCHAFEEKPKKPDEKEITLEYIQEQLAALRG